MVPLVRREFAVVRQGRHDDIREIFRRDSKTHKENKNPYYEKRNTEKVCRDILENFGLDPDRSHIINGHVPVQVKKGESPIKANGKLFVIDGGFAKAYQKETGIADIRLL